MADNGAAQSQSTQAWPLPSFYFKVSITNLGDMSCSEVSGLEIVGGCPTVQIGG
jgi:hypothetical protein